VESKEGNVGRESQRTPPPLHGSRHTPHAENFSLKNFDPDYCILWARLYIAPI
jgi:hypothetical protein